MMRLRAWPDGNASRSPAALALHGGLLANDILLAPQLRFGFAQALSITLWLAVAFYWIESLFVRLDGFEPLLLPLAAVVAPLPRCSRAWRAPAFQPRSNSSCTCCSRCARTACSRSRSSTPR
jgi:hypothetical protein